jgi:hypothetical protein
MNWSSDKEGKSKGHAVYSNGTYETWIASFTSEKKWNASFLRDFNPEIITRTVEGVFETPSSILFIYRNNKGEITYEQKFHKIE